jgi:hypothetical protein
MNAGDDRRRSKGGQGYGCTHGTVPRRWVVEGGIGEHHGDDSVFSGGGDFRAKIDPANKSSCGQIEARVRRVVALGGSSPSLS